MEFFFWSVYRHRDTSTWLYHIRAYKNVKNAFWIIFTLNNDMILPFKNYATLYLHPTIQLPYHPDHDGPRLIRERRFNIILLN